MSPTSLTIPLTISHFAPRPLRRLRGQSMPKMSPSFCNCFLPSSGFRPYRGNKRPRDPQSWTTVTIGIRMHFLHPFPCHCKGHQSAFCTLMFNMIAIDLPEMAAFPYKLESLLMDLETGCLPSVTVPCHWFAPGGCAISIPCPCSTFREDGDATPPCAAALPSFTLHFV